MHNQRKSNTQHIMDKSRQKAELPKYLYLARVKFKIFDRKVCHIYIIGRRRLKHAAQRRKGFDRNIFSTWHCKPRDTEYRNLGHRVWVV